jgi:hypothetical protein
MSRRHKLIVSKEFVDKKLIFRMRMFVVIFTIMIGIILYDIISDIISVPMAISGVSVGLIVGFIVGNLSNITWHPEREKVITRIDRAGVVVLIIYLSFSFSKKWIFGHWIHGPELTAFCFSTVSGIMAGRFFSIRFQIKDILKERGHIKK